MHSQPQEDVMHVFVTGATGFVGAAVVRELLDAGHAVTGLARSDEGAAALQAAGAHVQRGTLDDLDVLTRAAAAADGVVHTGFNHDFSKFAQNCEQDRRAIEALGAGLEGSRRPLLVTAGLALVAPGRLATETDPPVPVSPSYPRASEHAAAALAARGIHASTVRLPPSVHGAGDHGFVPMLIALARDKGMSACVGDGAHRWAGVHRRDAARVYRLALERGARGVRYHAVHDEGVTMRAIADVIARRLGVPRVDLADEEAAAHFGWFAHFAGMDRAASSAWTREVLGWQPRERGLLEDMASADYF
jgi:nucleoside-diphosphate-sugar epimerase